jgi:hypothetical protein
MTDIHLKPHPDWHGAAQRLVSGCLALPTDDQRVELMEKVCISLGDELYPTFLHILTVIGQHGDKSAQSLITDTLVRSLITGRLPSGRLAAWGSSTFSPNQMMGKTRSYGPIEYLLLWYAQPSGRPPLPVQRFQNAAQDLLSLIDSNPKAKALYCEKLLSDLDEPMDGSMSSRSRVAILAFLETWKSNESVDQAIEGFLDALQGDSISRLRDMDWYNR